MAGKFVFAYSLLLLAGVTSELAIDDSSNDVSDIPASPKRPTNIHLARCKRADDINLLLEFLMLYFHTSTTAAPPPPPPPPTTLPPTTLPPTTVAPTTLAPTTTTTATATIFPWYRHRRRQRYWFDDDDFSRRRRRYRDVSRTSRRARYLKYTTSPAFLSSREGRRKSRDVSAHGVASKSSGVHRYRGYIFYYYRTSTTTTTTTTTTTATTTTLLTTTTPTVTSAATPVLTTLSPQQIQQLKDRRRRLREHWRKYGTSRWRYRGPLHDDDDYDMKRPRRTRAIRSSKSKGVYRYRDYIIIYYQSTTPVPVTLPPPTLPPTTLPPPTLPPTTLPPPTLPPTTLPPVTTPATTTTTTTLSPRERRRLRDRRRRARERLLRSGGTRWRYRGSFDDDDDYDDEVVFRRPRWQYRDYY